MVQMINSATASEIPKRSPWVIAIFVFLGAIAVVNFYIYYLAFHSAVGLIEEDSYEKGQRYQGTIDGLTLGEGVSWEFSINPVGENSRLQVSIVDKKRSAVSGAMVTVLAQRPASEGMDISLVMNETSQGSGVYANQVMFPLKGLWMFEITAVLNGQSYIWRGREVVP